MRNELAGQAPVSSVERMWSGAEMQSSLYGQPRSKAGEHVTRDRDAEELEIGFWLRVIRRRHRLITLVVIVFTLTALAASVLQPTAYVASAEVRIPGTGIVGDTTTEPPNIALELRLLESQPLRDEVHRRLGFNPDVSLSGNDDAGTVNIDAKGRTRQQAVQVANVYAATYIELRRRAADNEIRDSAASLRTALDEVDRSLAVPNLTESQRARLLDQRAAYLKAQSALLLRAQLLQESSASILSPASARASSRALSTALYLIAAALVGAVVGVALGAIVDARGGRVRDPAIAVAALGIPLLGVVPAASRSARGSWFKRPPSPGPVATVQSSRGSAGVFGEKGVLLAEPGTAAADAFALVRTRFQSLADEKPAAVQVIAADHDDFTHSVTVAVNLARSLARANLQTVLVWANYRSHEALRKGPGMSDVLAGTVRLKDALQTAIAPSGLQVLPAGDPPEGVADALSSPAFANLLGELRTVADMTVVLTPPIGRHPEGQLVAATVDAVVVVAGERSRRQRLRQGIEILRNVSANVLGVVFVGRDRAKLQGNS